MYERVRSDLRFLFKHHRFALVAIALAAFQVVFLVATAAGARAEVRKQIDAPLAGSSIGALASFALDGRDPIAETDSILATMFGALVALDLASAAVIVLNTMLLLVEQRRPLIGQARALGASRGEIAARFQIVGGIVCALAAVPAFGLAWLAALALNATNVLHIFLDIRFELFALGTGLVGLAGLLGAWLPARAASRTDPWEAMRPLPVSTWRIPTQLGVVAASFWLAVLLVGLGSGVRDATLERIRRMPIADQRAFETMYDKVEQSMTSFRLILLVLPIANCLAVVSSTSHLAAYARRRETAVQRALGETRARLHRRVVLRSIRLCLIAWVVGALLALPLATLLGGVVLPFSMEIPLWGLVLSSGVSGLVGLIGGLGPAALDLAADPAELLKGV
jgi:ABC-type antimicrobial peptide transport system permease subunit